MKNDNEQKEVLLDIMKMNRIEDVKEYIRDYLELDDDEFFDELDDLDYYEGDIDELDFMDGSY